MKGAAYERCPTPVLLTDALPALVVKPAQPPSCVAASPAFNRLQASAAAP